MDWFVHKRECNWEAAQNNKKHTKTVIWLYQYQYSAFCLEWKIICIIQTKLHELTNKKQLLFPYSMSRQADLVWCNWLTTEGTPAICEKYDYNSWTKSQLLLSGDSELEVRGNMLPRPQMKKQC